MPRAAALLLLLLAAPLAGCDKPEATSRNEPPPVKVRVATVHLGQQANSLTVSGSVQARTVAELAFRVGGKVVERPVDVGQHVRAGQVLARLDPADLHLSLQVAESAEQAAIADAAEARADLARYRGLGPGSPAYLPSEYDRRLAAARMAEARLLQADRQLALARDQLAYGTLTADADGILTALPVEVGQVVAAGQPVARLAHTAETEVVVDVPENRLPDVRAARAVGISLWSDPDRKLAGRVREIGAQADAATRTFAVRVTVLNPPAVALAPPAAALALGMTASVTFTAPEAGTIAVLPAAAVTDQDGAPALWVLDATGTHATLRPVRLAGYGQDGTIRVAAGLAEGERVVTAGATLLDPGMRLAAWEGPAR